MLARLVIRTGLSAYKPLVGMCWAVPTIRAFSTEVAADATSTSSSTLGLVPEIPEHGKPKAKEAIAFLKNVAGSAKRLNDMCYMVRRLNTTEAITQMQLSRRQKYSEIMKSALQLAVRNAKHNFNMDPTRLVVVRADVGRATPLKRIKFHAKGRYGKMEHPRTHLRLVVREIEKHPDEKRLGLRGHKHATREGKGRANGRKEKWRRRRLAYRELESKFDAEGRMLGSPIADYLAKVRDRSNNEREWLRAMNLRIPPTRMTHHEPGVRKMRPNARPLQPNGGLASQSGKGERSALASAKSPDSKFVKHVWGGMSSSLVKDIKAKITARGQKKNTKAE